MRIFISGLTYFLFSFILPLFLPQFLSLFHSSAFISLAYFFHIYISSFSNRLLCPFYLSSFRVSFIFIFSLHILSLLPSCLCSSGLFLSVIYSFISPTPLPLLFNFFFLWYFILFIFHRFPLLAFVSLLFPFSFVASFSPAFVFI
jgi:hypothetical protein